MLLDGLLEVLNIWCTCTLATQLLIVFEKERYSNFLVEWYSCAESQGFREGTSEKLYK